MAAAVLAGAASYPAAAAERHGDKLAVLGTLGVAALLVGTAARLTEVIPAGLVLVGAEYASFVALRADGLDAAAPLVAGALVLAAEIAYSAVEPPLAPAAPALRALRAARVLALGIGGAGVAALLLYLSVADVRPGLILELIGIAAAVTALGTVAWLARRA